MSHQFVNTTLLVTSGRRQIQEDVQAQRAQTNTPAAVHTTGNNAALMHMPCNRPQGDVDGMHKLKLHIADNHPQRGLIYKLLIHVPRARARRVTWAACASSSCTSPTRPTASTWCSWAGRCWQTS